MRDQRPFKDCNPMDCIYNKFICLFKLFKNRVLRRIFGSKKDVNGEISRLRIEELDILYRSPSMAKVIKSSRLRWAGQVTRMEEGS